MVRNIVTATIFATVAVHAAVGQFRKATDNPTARRTILFVDDHEVLYRSGTKRVLHPAQRRSEYALIAQTKPWEVAIGWTSVYRNPKSGLYQLWYQAYAGHRAGDRKLKCVVCYAESKDGLHFKTPALNLHEFKEFKKKNIVLIGNGGYGDRYCNSVLVDPMAKDPAKRYKMAYYDWSYIGKREYPGLHVAFSRDGIHWTKHKQGPLFFLSSGETASSLLYKFIYTIHNIVNEIKL